METLKEKMLVLFGKLAGEANSLRECIESLEEAKPLLCALCGHKGPDVGEIIRCVDPVECYRRRGLELSGLMQKQQDKLLAECIEAHRGRREALYEPVYGIGGELVAEGLKPEMPCRPSK